VFGSRPDLQPPTVTVTVPADGAEAGLVLVAPFSIERPAPAGRQFGPLIVDDTGEPVWFRPLKDGRVAMNTRVQRYRGKPVLTWWQGQFPEGYGGEFMVVDETYRRVARVRAQNGLRADLHEFVITSRGSALVMVYDEVPADLTSIGGGADDRVVEGIVQEIDIASGRLLLEWRSLQHVALDETYSPNVTADGNVDYIHLNSIGVDRDGNLLVSARHTSTVYKLDRRTGAVIWRLGGKRSDFELEPGAEFAYQHDARRHADDTITIFDNAAAAPGVEDTRSRVMRLALDMAAMKARLVTDYRTAESSRLAFAMGNVQQLTDQGVFVGWGTYPSFSELSPEGEVRFDARFSGTDLTYRAFRQQWVGRPADPPTTAVRLEVDGSRTLLASWNGATEVARWQLRVGSSARTLRTVSAAERTGFETALPLPGSAALAVATAIDRTGKTLGSSPPLDVRVVAAALQPV
jgi:Arylsulfotransferase (ASST)